MANQSSHTAFVFDFWVENIQIKDFRGIEDMSVNFDEDLTILVGENGVGKTTALECVAKMLLVLEEKLRESLQSVKASDLFEQMDIRYRSEECESKIGLSYSQRREVLKKQLLKEDKNWEIALEESRVRIIEEYEGKQRKVNKVWSEEDDERIRDLEIEDVRRQKEIKRQEDYAKTKPETAKEANWKKDIQKQEKDKKEKKWPYDQVEERKKREINSEEIKRVRDKRSKDNQGERDLEIESEEAAFARFSNNISYTPELADRKHIEFSARITRSGNNDDPNFGDAELNRLLSLLKEKFKEKQPTQVSFAVYYPMRTANQYSSQGMTKETGILNAWDNALKGNHFSFQFFIEWFKWLQETQPNSTLVETTKKAIIAFLNGVVKEEGKPLEGKYSALEIDNEVFGRPELKVIKDGHPIYAHQMSSGEKSLFGLVADLARRLALACPDADDPLKEGRAVVLIDELDLHLHPKLQTTIVQSLRDIFPKCQFIISTHSPLILAQTECPHIRKIKEGKAELIEDAGARDYMSVVLEEMEVFVRPQLYHKHIKAAEEELESDKKKVMNHQEAVNRKTEHLKNLALMKEFWRETEKIMQIEADVNDYFDMNNAERFAVM